MTGLKDFKERMEFPLAFLLSMIAGLLAFLLVSLLSDAWEFYRAISQNN